MSQDAAVSTRLEKVFGGFTTTNRPARARDIAHVVGNETDGYNVFHDCRRLIGNVDIDTALVHLVAGINNAAIASCNQFAVHSGVVAGHGSVIALPAQSGDGKTTLTAALLKTGFDYLSDEALVLTDAGEVIAYPKPLAISAWSASRLGFDQTEDERLYTPDALAADYAKGGSQVTEIVIAEYGHRLELDQLSKSAGQAALIRLSFNHFKDPRSAFETSAHVASGARTWNLLYDDPIEAATALKRALGV